MKKGILTIFTVALLIGCGDDKSKDAAVEVTEADMSQIKVMQGEKRVEQENVQHKEALKKDKKGFYYAYDEKEDDNASADETFTRVDAEKRVKNQKVVDGKIAVREKNYKASTPYQYVRIDLLKNALSHDFMVKCSACHDDYANGVIGPSLLEKDGNYIYGQMLKYKNDPTKNILMYELVNQMTEDEVKSISNEVAQFNKEIRALRGSK